MHAVFLYAAETTVNVDLVLYKSGVGGNCIWFVPTLECPF
jgi:hypothetical protein